MKMTPLQKLAATAFLATSFFMTGCGSSSLDQAHAPVVDDGITIEMIEKGSILQNEPAGLHEVTLKADKWSGDYDLHCIGMKGTSGTHGYGGLACDFK